MLSVMNPFEQPPSTPPVSTEPPVDSPTSRRGRMALVALASAGLVAGGIVGISAVGSADDPQLETSDVARAATVDDGTGDENTGDENTGDDTGDDGTSDDGDDPVVDGEVTIDLGDGEPIVIDIGELSGLDDERLAELGECLGLPLLEIGPMGDLPFEFPEGWFETWIEEVPGEFDGFELPDDLDGAFRDLTIVPDGEVTVFGPDGMTVIDLGEGDASVTISRDGASGELTITTEGTATEQTFDDLFGDFEFGELTGMFDELFGELPEGGFVFDFPGEFGELSPDEIEDMFGEFPMFDGFDPERLSNCLADLG